MYKKLIIAGITLLFAAAAKTTLMSTTMMY